MPTVFLHLTINRDRDEAVRLVILELHDLMPGTRKPAPPTRLLR